MKTMLSKVTSAIISPVVDIVEHIYSLNLEDVELDYVDLEDVKRQRKRIDLARIKVNE